MNQDIIEKVKDIISSNVRDDGWAELASIGLLLNKNGIQIKTQECKKLKDFFLNRMEDFEMKIDSKTNLPLVRVLSTTRDIDNHIIHLKEWANINQKLAVESLRKMALPEKWSFNQEDENYPSPILAKYLKWTFVKLMRENKILYAKNFAAFNTGLVDNFISLYLLYLIKIKLKSKNGIL